MDRTESIACAAIGALTAVGRFLPIEVTADDVTREIRFLAARLTKAERERDEANERANRCSRERREALDVKTREGLTASEWILRTGRAEACVEQMMDLLLEARGLVAGLAADLIDRGGGTVNVGNVHRFHARLAAVLADADGGERRSGREEERVLGSKP